ncbi:hypothetical protein [Limnoglobus roseus]|uniref:SMI1/KNR4 family protein n=1 Tax=Limnoglobus roseus TaxID=2598579 RepID=A0A5C1AK61_9BACT|nr:hypothetical protein [Limnoglobus roseus]QEL18406.1 hypothetical protein PX52LOC_05430 [Limnoglobus roseus]
MTEAEWLAASNPALLLGFLRGSEEYRKFRLFACACARRVVHLVRDERAKAALGFAEQLADRTGAARRGRPAIHKAGLAACQSLWGQDQGRFDSGELLAHLAESNATHAAVKTAEADATVAAAACTTASLAAAYTTCRPPRFPTPFPPDRGDRIADEERTQVVLFRDIFGSPFRPVTFSPSWLTPTAIGLAEAIYADLAFDRLPILADALQDAGCEDIDILAHCRGDWPHARGCWVVDGVLGKR